MSLPPMLERHYDELIALCEQHGVERLYAFGSVVSDRFNEARSDLDFIAEMLPMPPIERGESLMNFWTGLEELFERKIDLLTEQPIKNPYLRQSIEASKQLIYDRTSEKVSV